MYIKLLKDVMIKLNPLQLLGSQTSYKDTTHTVGFQLLLANHRRMAFLPCPTSNNSTSGHKLYLHNCQGLPNIERSLRFEVLLHRSYQGKENVLQMHKGYMYSCYYKPGQSLIYFAKANCMHCVCDLP